MFFEPILDIFFPKFCLSCQKEGFYVCPACFAKIPLQKGIRCYICGKRSPNGKTCIACKTKSGSKLTGLLIASDWNNMLVRQMIYEFKYRFIDELSNHLAEILIKFLEINKFFSSPDHKLISLQTNNKFILIPVPLHKRRLSWRGFNQSELLAQQINNYFKIPIINNLLFRAKYTSPQMEIIDQIQRIKNVSGAFKIKDQNENPLRNKSVILVDDVCTTAATFENCARALGPLKPKEIWALALARG
jgi:ComF family protein